jgi:hypothetical protein
MSAPRPATAVPSADRTTHGVRSGPLAVGADVGAAAADCVPGDTDPDDPDDPSGSGDDDLAGSGVAPCVVGGGTDRTPSRTVKPRRSPNATIQATRIFFLRAGVRSLIRAPYVGDAVRRFLPRAIMRLWPTTKDWPPAGHTPGRTRDAPVRYERPPDEGLDFGRRQRMLPGRRPAPLGGTGHRARLRPTPEIVGGGVPSRGLRCGSAHTAGRRWPPGAHRRAGRAPVPRRAPARSRPV